MLIAFLADVHANREALEACVQHARACGVMRFVFLGDLVGYGADPDWVVSCVMDLVARREARAVLGNHDAAVAGALGLGMHHAARKGIDWTRSRLTDAQRDFLATLPMTVEDGDMLYVHANAFAPGAWEYVLGPNEARASLAATACRYTFCGHVHEPALYHLNRSGQVAHFAPVAGAPIRLGGQRRWLAIAGTVGQPRDGKVVARYALFETESALLSFQEVPYDFEAALSKAMQAGLPPNVVIPPARHAAPVR